MSAEPAYLSGNHLTPQPGGVPSRRPERVRAVAAAISVFAVYVVFTLALFPEVTMHLATAFPADLGDPPSQAWVLAWDVHALAANPSHVWDGNIFYPQHDTLAYQDTLLALLPVAAPLLLLTGNPILTYNALFLLSFASCAWMAYLLARLLVRDARAAFAAGLIYGFSAYRMVHLSHLNLLCAMWIPLALYCWEGVRRGDWRYWTGIGLCVVLQMLSALYYAVYLTVALAILIGVWAYRRRRTPDPGPSIRSVVTGALVTACSSALVLLPFLLPFFRVEHRLGASRGLGQVVYFSADLRDFLHSQDLSLLYGWTGQALGVRPADALQYLWPGIAALVLALCYGRLPLPRGVPDVRRDYAILCLAAAVFCLGPFLKVWGVQTGVPLPYLLLYVLPGMAGLRDPARFGAIYTLCLGILAAYGMSAILARIPPRRSWIVAVGITAAVAAELWMRPLPVVAMPVGQAIPPVYRWLAGRPAREPVLELPIGLQNRAVWAEQAEMMYFSTYHWHPIINGTGGFAPPGYASVAAAYNAFPSPAALRLLRARHVRYVIVHRDWVGAARAVSIRRDAARIQGVHLIVRWPDVDAYAVDP